MALHDQMSCMKPNGTSEFKNVLHAFSISGDLLKKIPRIKEK